MTNTNNFILVELFNEYYKNTCKLKVSIIGHPKFGELRSVSTFSDEEKAEYMMAVNFAEYIARLKKAIVLKIIEPFDFDDILAFEMPENVMEAYWEHKMYELFEAGLYQ